MKKINTLLFVTLLAFVSACSSDDDKQTCNCNKIVATYNEQMDAFEPIDTEHYSDNCDDQTTVYNVNPEQEGTYYVIQCSPNP